MNYKEFISKFHSQVSRMHPDRSKALALHICKKLFFDYQEFCDARSWGDPDLLMDAIALAERLAPGAADGLQIGGLLVRIDRITPDSEVFEDAAYAINACNAVYETLQFLVDKDPGHIYDAASCWTDTIDFRLQAGFSLSEDQLDRHPEIIQARTHLLDVSR